MVIDEDVVERERVLGFDAFFVVAEPRLRRALIARYGIDSGREATIDALTYAWRHWERVAVMENPVGYLYRVGTSSARVQLAPMTFELVGDVASERGLVEPLVEPGLEAGLDTLSEAQRVAVVLRHSFEWTYAEIAELLEVSVSSVRNHLDRAMTKLRAALEVDDV